MKKIILFSLLLISVFTINAQTNGGNTNGQTPPEYQNPYRDEVTPFVNEKNKNNIFDNEKDDRTNDDKNKSDKKELTESEKKQQELDFRDRNEQDRGKSAEELRQLYKDDPAYLKYLGLLDEEGLDVEDIKKNEEEDITLRLYGANFLTSGINAGTNRITTVPDDYRLGVGDEIVVSVWGASEYQNSFTIASDGSIFPNRIGKIFLQGMSFQAARNLIRSRFNRVLPGGSNVDIVLEKVRTIRVYVYGEVNKPGMITISALNTPLNALQQAGGLNPYGNMRDIQVRRNGMVIEHIDIYDYLKNGNSGREIYLQDNDYITVGLYDKIVQAKGSFKRPMRYQLNKYEGLNDLIDLAGGMKFDARKSLIRIKTVFNEQEQYIDINGKNLLVEGDYILKDGDVVNINLINKGVSNVVTIEGSVAYPDEYQISEGDKIFDIINKAGGLNSNAYLARAFVLRNGSTTEDSKALKIDLSDYGNNASPENILLENGDVIQILSENQFDEKFFVQVKGLVRKPGRQGYKKNMRLKDVLLLAGGLELQAESGRIEISNITDSVSRYSITGRNVNVRVAAISPNLEIDEISENIIIKPYDIIYVRQKTNISEQKEIYIVGEVDYPGPYALLGDNERLTSLLIRSGGLKAQAYPEGAQLKRKSYGPILIDLKSAMLNAGGKEDFILENGDSLIIPKKMEIVSVTGNVQNPVNIKYLKNKKHVKNYINDAGGLGHRPWRSKISVEYQNGIVKQTKNFLFFKFYPKVKAGSIINIPTRPEPRKIDLANTFQYALATTTSILTVLILIQNTK